MPGIKRLPGETAEQHAKRIGEIVSKGIDPEIKEIIKSLTGIIKGDYSLDEVKMEALRARYDRTR
ncbi:MAG: hypothetical protein IJT21_01115 [Synergistaceae bacterium]|nr:hypothetical protein [Synergistaceae bacterium]